MGLATVRGFPSSPFLTKARIAQVRYARVHMRRKLLQLLCTQVCSWRA